MACEIIPTGNFYSKAMNPKVSKNVHSNIRNRAPISVVPLMFMCPKSSGTPLTLIPHKNTRANKKFLEKASRENNPLWRFYYIEQQGVHLELSTHHTGRMCIVY